MMGSRTKSIIAVVGLAGALSALMVLARPGPASARPSYGAATGQACGVCHINPAGGGPRTPMGLAFAAIPNYASDPAGAWAQVTSAPTPPPPATLPQPTPTPPPPPPALAGAPPTSAEQWPPVKVDMTVQQDGSMFTAVVWVRNEGDFDTDVLNVKGRVPTGAKYVDSWAGSGRGFNAGVFDGKDVAWVNAGVKAGARQGPFVYVFDASAVPAGLRPSVSAWVSWAGKVPGTAVSTAVASKAPSEVLTKLDAGIGAPPAAGWKWQVMQRTTGPAEVAEGSNDHGNFWAFYVLKGSHEAGIGDGKRVLGVGEATLIPQRQEHTHRFPAQSEILGFHVRPSDRPPGDSHGGQLLFNSEQTIEAPAGNYSVRLREFTLARGEQTSATIGPGPFAYVMEGTLSTRSGSIMSTIDAGKVLSLPGSETVVVGNEGTSPLRFVLVDLHPEVVALSTVRVVIPDPDNLQYLNFWTALGAGFFKEEGLDVQVLTPPSPLATLQFLFQGRAEVALLPPPQYLPPIAQGQPLLIFANLLQNDPINLVVRKEVAEARKLSPTAPLAERLKGMQGLKVGVAQGPPPRLRALFASAGMDIDRDIQVVILGEERFQAFAGNPIDALYAHTPFLEKALVEQGAMLLVDQLRGEFPELTGFNIHSLVTTRDLAAANPKALVAMTRAIYRAQQLIHSDLKASASALLRSGVPGVEQMPVETTLRLYEPAVPKTPEVSITAIERTNKYFWGSTGAPADLGKVNLPDYVAPQFAERAVGG